MPRRYIPLRFSPRPLASILIPLLAVFSGLHPSTPYSGLAAGSRIGARALPTYTPLPSATDVPTVTPTATNTAVPTATDMPTATAPTATVPPTATVAATATVASPPSPTVTVTQQPTPAPEPSFPRHHVVLIVIDAARMATLAGAKLPHIQALMQHGVVYDRAWVGEMQSSTPNVHVTIGTGTLPRQNGFLGFGWAAPGTRKQIDFRTLLANGAIEPVLNNLPVPSVTARLHQFMPGSTSIASSGHKDYAVVGLGGGKADYEIYGRFNTNTFVPTFIPGHVPPHLTAAERRSLTVSSKLPVGGEDSWAFKYASIVVRHTKPRLLMMNLPEMDTWGHWRGPNDQRTAHKLMMNVDHGIGLLVNTYRRLGILQNTDFIITADHSMMESTPARSWTDVWTAAKAVNAQVARADGEGGAVWLQDPGGAKAVAQRLVAMRPAHVQAIFYRSAPGNDFSYLQASPTGWMVNRNVAPALQHLVNTTAGQNGPDLWVLYRENYTVVSRNVAGIWKGTHGGATWKVQHIPFIMSGPGIRTGVHSQFGARIIDIAPTMERLLGLPSMRRDGVVLADALVSPTGSEARAQGTVAPIVGADVQALQQESVLDGNSVTHWPRIPVPPFRCGPKPPAVRPCGTTPKTATNS